MPVLSLVVPVLDEATTLDATLAPLGACRAAGVELVVVDGGSRDASRAIAARHADRVVEAPRGRASQMNAGARAAAAPLLLFLHADTVLPRGWLDLVRNALATHAWGRFDVAIDGRSRWLPVVAAMMNARSRLSGIATGDQAMFVRRDAFEAVGGFADIPLMEDVALSKALRRLGSPASLRARVRTSGRRWERRGPLRTIVLMWRLRLAYALGADPAVLARRYEVERTAS